MVLKRKSNILLITTIFLCTWGVYSSNTDKAPLVLEVTDLGGDLYEYFYLQEPKMKDDKVKYDHDIWYKDRTGAVIMFSTLEGQGEVKKWVMAGNQHMHKTNPSVCSRYDHQGEPPMFPTEKNDSETWKGGNISTDDSYIVKAQIPAISNIESSGEIKIHLDFIAVEKTTTGVLTEYVKTKLQDMQFRPFQSLCEKYNTINILLNVTTKKEEFDQELLEFKKKYLYTNKDAPLPPLYQEKVDLITKIFNNRIRIYWITGITVVLIIVICIILCTIRSKQAQATDDMTIDEYDIYDEENPAPRPQVSSNSEEYSTLSMILSTVSSQNLFSSEENFDHHPTTDDENTKSVESEKELSHDIVPQQEADTDTLFFSEEISDSVTNDNINSVEETSVEKIKAEKSLNTNTNTAEKTPPTLPKNKKED